MRSILALMTIEKMRTVRYVPQMLPENKSAQPEKGDKNIIEKTL